ncbi:MAG: SDR family oxidoreductase [Deltaproteobacteria bacterium]|nr:MAG: SDR family oxidoreductase [Deltaproteobacteria bacterium]
MTTALVTGANRGIGLELARQLKDRGVSVIAACRRSSPELDALGVRVETDVDVTDADSVTRLAQRIDGPIDLLVNNAGILTVERLGNLDYDAIRRQFEVNALGPLRVTETLAPHLADGAKVAIITSRMGSIADNTSGSMYGYRMSKAAVNMAGASLAQDLKGRGIAVALLHPGAVKTEMTGGHGQVEADFSVQGLLARIDEMNLENTGAFWHAQGEALPW